jgi:hypothetical protein
LAVFFILLPVFLPGWSAERENRDRVIRVLNEGAVSFEERSLLSDYGGFGSSVHARLPRSGEEGWSGKEAGTFVLAVPLERSYAVEAALAFIGACVRQGTVVDILVAFLGDEYNRLPPDVPGTSHKGLRDLLSLPDMPENWVLCCLDIEEAPEHILIRHGTGDYIAPLDVVRPLTSRFLDRGIPASFEIRYNELYKLGLAAGPEELALVWEAEINGFCLSARSRNGASGGIPPEILAELLLDYAGDLDFPVQNPDRHYSFLTVPGTGKILYIPEGAAALALLGMAALFVLFVLVYSAVYRAAFFLNFKFFFKFSWIFIIFLPLLVLILGGAGFLYDFILTLLKKPVPPADYAGAGIVILLAVWLFYILFQFLDFTHIPRKHNFYGVSAMILAALGLFTAAVIDFTYIPVFLWAFFFVFLGAVSRKAALVIVSALFIPVQALGAFVNIRETGSGALAALFLRAGSQGSWAAALQVAALFLPFVLLLKRGARILNMKRRRPVWKIPLRFRFIILAVILGAMAGYAARLPGAGSLPVRRYAADNGDILELSLGNTFFQESRILEIRVNARGNPARFDLFLESPDHRTLPLVYSAPCPVEEQEGGTAAFILGEDPPNPFTAEIVLSRDFSGSLRVEALYTVWDAGIDPEPEPGTDDYVVRVVRTEALTASGSRD